MPEQPQRIDSYVFLSYASADREQALRIADLLEAQGIRVWMDRHSIAGGSRWSAEIVAGIEGCSALIVLCTVAAMQSRNVRQEIQLAWDANRPCLPLLLEDVRYPGDVRYALAGQQWIEVRDQPAEIWLPRALRALTGLGVTARDAGQAAATKSPIDTARPPVSAVQGEVAPGPSIATRPPVPSGSASPLSRLLARAPLVGRAAELAYLREQYDAAAAGQGGRLVFISGEPGAGKTRLAQEVGTYAVSRGGLFLEGHYLRDGTAAYGPWVEALRRDLRSATCDEIARWVGGYAPDLGQAVPDLVEQMGPLPPRPDFAPEEQRRRLLEGIAGLVIGLSQKLPLVLLLDDLQWAPGLGVLAHLARRLGEVRALIVGTYREQEFKEQPSLRREWAELNRTRLATDINLHLLSEAETAELIGHYFGAEPARQLREPVYRRTRGNAFFTEEVLRSLTETGAVRAGPDGWEVADTGKVAIPESMKLAVEERVARLGETAREVLVQASVLGQEFSFPALRAVTGLSEDDLIEVFDQTVAARLLVDRSAEGEERFAFLDDQMQEVLYAGIPPSRRRRYHLRAGQALEEAYAGQIDTQLEELARHFSEGNDPPRAADYAQRAAEKNERLFHWLRARRFYERAVDALARFPSTDDNQRRRVDTILNLVRVAWATDVPEYSLARLAQAKELVADLSERGHGGADGPPRADGRLAQIYYWMGRFHYRRNEQTAAREYLDQALTSAFALEDRELSALASSAIGRVFLAQGYPDRARPFLSQAIEPLEKTSRAWEWVATVGVLAMVLAMSGDRAEALVQVRRAMIRARTNNDPRGLALIYSHLSIVHFLSGNLLETLKTCHDSMQAAEQSGDQFWVHVSLGFQGWVESRLGRHADARASFASLRTLDQNLGGRLTFSDWFAAAEAEIAFNAGAVEDARCLAEQAVTYARSMGGSFAEGLAQRVWGQALAELNPGRWGDAEEHLAASLYCFEEGEARLEAARTHVVWGQLLHDRGDTAAAREHLEKAAAQFDASGLTEELA